MISWLPHFILLRETRETFVQVLLALQIAGHLQVFLCFLFFFISTEPLETQAPTHLQF